MKPVLAAVRVKKLTAEATDAVVINQKVTVSVGQVGEVKFGLGPDGKSLVQSTMSMDASVCVENTKVELLKVHGEFEGVFVELEPTIDNTSTEADAKNAADFYSAHLYPHAISYMNRMLHEMGFGAAQLDLKYPGAL